jgi:hypothetical protein
MDPSNRVNLFLEPIFLYTRLELKSYLKKSNSLKVIKPTILLSCRFIQINIPTLQIEWCQTQRRHVWLHSINPIFLNSETTTDAYVLVLCLASCHCFITLHKPWTNKISNSIDTNYESPTQTRPRNTDTNTDTSILVILWENELIKCIHICCVKHQTHIWCRYYFFFISAF